MPIDHEAVRNYNIVREDCGLNPAFPIGERSLGLMGNGITMLDFFAGLAMAALIATRGEGCDSSVCYAMARRMIEERNKEMGGRK
jgi:hypothetical protein